MAFASFPFGRSYFAEGDASVSGPITGTLVQTLGALTLSASGTGGALTKGAGWLVTSRMSYEQSYAYWKRYEEASRRVSQRGGVRIRCSATKTSSRVGKCIVSGDCNVTTQTQNTLSEVGEITVNAGSSAIVKGYSLLTECQSPDIYTEQNFSEEEVMMALDVI